MSNGVLAGSVLELTQSLSKNNAAISEQTAEKDRLTKIHSDFLSHRAWQNQRVQTLRRNLERLHNETKWLSEKRDEVGQDVQIVRNDLRQVMAEMGKATERRDAQQLEVLRLDEEVKLEQDATAALHAITAQASKALAAHERERDAYRAGADRHQSTARKLRDRVEEAAYMVNGLAIGALSV